MNGLLRTTLAVLGLGLLLGCAGKTLATDSQSQGAGGTIAGGTGGAIGGTGGAIGGTGGAIGGAAGAAGGARTDAGLPVGSVTGCKVVTDCTWGEIDHEILAKADCMCLFGCPGTAMNATTYDRRQKQYSTLCNPKYDGAGNPCPIDECAPPGPIACIYGTCQVPPTRTGLACNVPSDCGGGFDCLVKAAGGYCLPGVPGTPMNCGMAGQECLAETTCSPVPWLQIANVCLRSCTSQSDCRPNQLCNYVEQVPGSGKSPTMVCWTACQPGMDQSCNDSSVISSIHGTCMADGTCLCNGSFGKNPATGRCY
jgi:hypothetical protein